MRARGFSLIELMIAMAIVAMLAGLVLPIGMSRLNADSFRQAQRQLESAVGVARASAQRRGVLLKLVVVERDGEQSLWAVEHTQADPKAKPRREFVLELAAGISIAPAPVTDPDAESSGDVDISGNVSETPIPRGSAEQPDEIAICVLLPDGGVTPGEPVSVKGRAGESARIEFNPWTGALTFTRIAPAAAEDPDSPPPSPGSEP